MIPDDHDHDLSLTGRLLRDLPREDWQEHRADTARRFLAVAGEFPPAPPLDIQWNGDTVTFHGITATVLRPAGEKLPAVVCPHPTHATGRHATARSGIDGYAYGYELAQRGFITICPDHFAVPDYDSRAFEKQHPNWSPAGKSAWDVMRCIDVLETLPEVDKGRIGCMGFSLGGNQTLWAAAFDQRIKAAVIASGVSTLRGDRNWRELWVREAGNFHYFPKLTAGQPFDFHEIAALIAPRPLLMISGYHDQWCSGSAIMGEFATRVHDIYDLYGKAAAFAHVHHGEGHAFSATWRNLAYEWLEKNL